MAAAFHFDNAGPYAGIAMLCAVFCVSLLVVGRRFPFVRGARLMAAAFLSASLAASALLAMSHRNVQDSDRILLSTTLIWTTYLLLYAGIAAALGMRARLWFASIVAAISLAVISWYGVFGDHTTVQVVLVSVASSVIQASLLTDLIQSRQRSAMVKSLIALMAILIVTNLVRGAGTLSGTHSLAAASFDRTQSIYILTAMLRSCAMGVFCLVLLGRQVTAHFEQNARRDPLTGALNRLGIEDRLALELGKLQQTGQPLSIVMLDVDEFKRVNDEGGHSAGDAALCRLVRCIGNQVREGDAVGRMGGDEFLLVLPGASCLEAADVCERVRQWFAAGSSSSAARPITISLGFTEAAGADTRMTLIERADRALYLAKQSGRNCAEVALLPIAAPDERPSFADTAGIADGVERMQQAGANGLLI